LSNYFEGGEIGVVLERRRRAEATVHSTGEGNGCIFVFWTERNETKRFLCGWRAVPDIWIFTFPLVFVTAIFVLPFCRFYHGQPDASRVGWYCHGRECRIARLFWMLARCQVLQCEFCIQSFVDLHVIGLFVKFRWQPVS